jgi:MFS family permease
MSEGVEAIDAKGESRAFRILRHFLAVRFAAQTANQTQAVAVGWYIYALTDSALDLGLIGLMQFVPFASLALLAGHFIDRYPRQRVVMVALAVETLCSVALALLALFHVGGAGAVFAVIACIGAVRAFEQPAMQSWLPNLVPRRVFPRAAAWNSLTSQSAVIVGPSLGGVLYLFGPSVPFLVAAGLLSFAFLATVALPGAQKSSNDEPLSWRGLMGGVRFIWGNEAVRGTISLDLFAVLFGGATALLPIFAQDILAIGPAGLGILRSAPAAGALVTGLLLTRLPPQRHVGRRMLIAVAVYGAATIVFGLSSNTILSMAALMVLGAADMLSVVIRSTLVQIASPDAVRGRVTAVNSLFTGTSNQLGQFESGLVASLIGPVGSVVLGGAATLIIVAAWARRFPALRRMDRIAMAGEA